MHLIPPQRACGSLVDLEDSDFVGRVGPAIRFLTSFPVSMAAFFHLAL